MPLICYEAIKDELRGLNETDLVRWSEPPQVGQTIAIGSDRRWSIVAVETYQANDRAVYIALIHPEGADIPDRSEWALQQMREWSPNLSFDVQIWQKTILGSGWSMEGVAPTGRLYNSKPTDHPTLMQRVPRPWAVDIVETYKPIGDGSYNSVHLCHCVPVSLPEFAVA